MKFGHRLDMYVLQPKNLRKICTFFLNRKWDSWNKYLYGQEPEVKLAPTFSKDGGHIYLACDQISSQSIRVYERYVHFSEQEVGFLE